MILSSALQDPTNYKTKPLLNGDEVCVIGQNL